jgi:tetratricopeptide (TPR) repeat protein/DNA-binding CsgD family transcriptional regulator
MTSPDPLNEREQEIVKRLAIGQSDQQIADELFLSVNTVKWYNRQIYSKLGVRSRTQAIACVNDLGLLQSSVSPLPHSESRSHLSTQTRFLPGRNSFFLGREEVLARLRRQLQASQTTVHSQPQAICGLGGVGKTQVALEYAYRHAQDYQSIFWTQAASRDTLAASFLTIATMLHLPERNEQDQSVVIAAVKEWLRQNTNWLLILDNADDLSLLPAFLPSSLSGHLLLTTRVMALGKLASRIDIETLDLDNASLLLLRRAGLLALDASLAHAHPADWQAAVQLAQELGCLPLALDQAGAYLEETHCGLQQYLDLYRCHRSDLLRYRGGLSDDHPNSVTTTWSLSFTLIEQQSALAAELLRLCAVLHPESIPEALFRQAAPQLGPVLALIETDPLAFNQALALIQNSSLLQRNGREHTLSIHRLVQAVLTDAMTDQEQEQWRRRALAALERVFPDMMHQGWEQWELCSHLLPHVLTVAASIDSQTQSLELASLLRKAADYLCQRAQYDQAEPLYRRALSLCEQMLGHDHPQVAFPLYGLAGIYREQGNYQRAEPLYQQALNLWEQTPAPAYPEITALLNDLAILYLEQGNLQRAEQLLHRALHLNEQIFGETHPEVAFPLTNLADLYREQKRYAEAEPLYQRALQIRDQALGSSHPQVAFPLSGLANLYCEQGRYAEAEPLYQRALTIRYQQRGAQHPETADSLQEVARLHELRNQPEQALRLSQQALHIREQRLGLQHPRTLETRSYCARLLRLCGHREDAAEVNLKRDEDQREREQHASHEGRGNGTAYSASTI